MNGDMNDDMKDHNISTKWFNIGHHTPIIHWSSKLNEYDEEESLDQNPEYRKMEEYIEKIFGEIHNTSDNLCDDEINNSSVKLHDKLVDQLDKLRNDIIDPGLRDMPINNALLNLQKNVIMNEMQRTITQMVYIFWSAAINWDYGDDGGQLDFVNDADEIKLEIISKVEENMNKIKQSEYEVFSLDNLIGNGIEYDKYSDVFTMEVIKKITDEFKVNTISYHVGGAYNCNEASYEEYVCNAHFGFFNIKAS